MSEERVQWLIDEVRESLDAGATGLYEFLWIQRSRFRNESTDELIAVARLALDRIMRADPPPRFIWLRWPSFEPLPGPPVGELTDEFWADPTDQLYLALSTAPVDASER